MNRIYSLVKDLLEEHSPLPESGNDVTGIIDNINRQIARVKVQGGKAVTKKMTTYTRFSPMTQLRTTTDLLFWPVSPKPHTDTKPSPPRVGKYPNCGHPPWQTWPRHPQL